MKIYQIIFQDEWNNLYEVGWYKDLKDAINDINAEIGDERVQVTDENFVEYAGTFGPVFDLCLADICDQEDEELIDEFCSKYIRGFIMDSTCLLDTIQDLEKRGEKND